MRLRFLHLLPAILVGLSLDFLIHCHSYTPQTLSVYVKNLLMPIESANKRNILLVSVHSQVSIHVPNLKGLTNYTNSVPMYAISIPGSCIVKILRLKSFQTLCVGVRLQKHPIANCRHLHTALCCTIYKEALIKP